MRRLMALSWWCSSRRWWLRAPDWPGPGRLAVRCSARSRSAPTRTPQGSIAASTSPRTPARMSLPRQVGTVTFAGTVPTHGRTISILTPDGYSVTLTHLGDTRVKKGDVVEEGQPVARAGVSGTPEWDRPYVHLGVRVATQAEGYVDPLSLLPPRGTTVAPPAPDPVPQPTPHPPPSPPAEASSETPPPPVPETAAPPVATSSGSRPVGAGASARASRRRSTATPDARSRPQRPTGQRGVVERERRPGTPTGRETGDRQPGHGCDRRAQRRYRA